MQTYKITISYRIGHRKKQILCNAVGFILEQGMTEKKNKQSTVLLEYV